MAVSSDQSYYQNLVADRYIIKEQIGVGGMGVIWRAMPYHDPSQDVAIKFIPKTSGLGAEGVLRFQKEAALMARLHHPNIICFHQLGVYGQNQSGWDGYYMVMEIGAGYTLKESIKGGRDLSFFFQVALQVTSALDYTHGKNIIHRDIKPQNIMTGDTYHQQGILVKVLDFGVARLAEATHTSRADGGQEVAGTPMYMAPEQTGLFAAPVDHRSDLYSLGCVFYEILSGEPVFSATSRESLMARHAKAIPEPLRNRRPDVPEYIESVIMKLLAKHPDDRYKTAFGLYADLQRARGIYRSRRSGVKFTLGLKDGFKAVSAQLKLIGREEAKNKIIDGYNSLSSITARSHMTVVRGHAGMGKTRLLSEFRQYLGQFNVRFINVSFSRHENNLPYNALANGFNEYLVRLLKGQPHEAEELKRKVKTVLGPTALLVADKVPGLKFFLDPDLEFDGDGNHYGVSGELSDEQEFKTFAKAFSDFTRCLAMDNQSVVFILDDTHWADSNSLALVEEFFSHNNSQRFYLVISYRSTDRENFKDLGRFLTKFKKLRRRYREVDLTPLEPEHVRELVGHMINSHESVSDELVAFLCQKTGGNPLFLVEMIRTLVAQERINYDRKLGIWNYKVNNLYRDNIRLDSVDLTTNRIQSYDEQSRRVLEVASVIGMTFQFEILLVNEIDRTITVTTSALKKAIAEGLVVQKKEDQAMTHLGEVFMFVHPKAREYILDNIPRRRRCELHLKVAERLEKLVLAPDNTVLFSLAHHFNQVIDEDFDERSDLPSKVIYYNTKAGLAAKHVSSYDQADRYLKRALVVAASDPNKFEENLAQIYELLGDISGEKPTSKGAEEAIGYYTKLLQMKVDRSTYAKISVKMNRIDIFRGKITIAMERIHQNIRQLGMKIPVDSSLKKLNTKLSLSRYALPMAPKNNPLYRLCRKAYKIGQNDREVFSGLELYHQAQIVFLKENSDSALSFHNLLLKMCEEREVPPALILKVVCDRALLIGSRGFVEKAYTILDIAIDMAQSLKLTEAHGYILLYRVLMLDDYKGKYEDLDRKVREAIGLLSLGGSNSIHLGYAKLYLISCDFMKGNTQRVRRSARSLLRKYEIPYRNWLNPRAFSIYFFSLYLEGLTHSLVTEADIYLQMLEKVGARKRDLFVYVIRTLVATAKGQHRIARKYYLSAAGLWLSSLADSGKDRPGYLFPFEEDFLGLFVAVVPEIYAREHDRSLVGSERSIYIHKNLAKAIEHRRMNKRATAKLLKARCADVLGARGVSQSYDIAIRVGKASDEIIVTIFAYYWFGRHLLKKSIPQKETHLERARKLAEEKELRSVVSMCEQSLRQFRVKFSPLQSSRLTRSVGGEGKEIPLTQFTQSGYQLLHNCLASAERSDLHVFFNAILDLFRINTKVRGMYVVSVDDGRSEISPYFQTDEAMSAQVIDYTKPYSNLKSALYLPAYDSPWFDRQSRSEVDDLDENSTQLISDENDQTLIVGESDLNSTKEEEEVIVVSKQWSNIIVPIPFLSRNIGTLFLEGVDLVGGPSSTLRQELDYLGAQLGLALSNLNPSETSLMADYGIYSLEECPWLRVWHRGPLRKDRESTWYLGMNLGESDYLLVYLRINGQEEVRTFLASTVWYHLHIMRSLILSSHKIAPSLIEIKEELIKIFRGSEVVKRVDQLSLTITMFNRGRGMAFSGHFGLSRPLVINSQNNVSPDNDVVFDLNNGRSLKYWAVQSELGAGKFYILPHDSSRIDSISKLKEVKLELTGDPERDLERLLEKQLIQDNIPRYYVAAYLESYELDETLPKVQ